VFELEQKTDYNPSSPQPLTNPVPGNAVPPSSPKSPAEAWGEVYTMPSLTGGSRNVTPAVPISPLVSDAGNKGNKMWLWISLGVLAALALAVGIYFFFVKGGQSSSNTNTSTNTPVVEQPTEPNPPAEPPVTTPQVTPAERDRDRFRDVTSLQAALRLYFNDVKKYPIAPLPITLGQDSTKILSSAGFTPVEQKQGTLYFEAIPQDPSGGSNSYVYESMDGTVYAIKFTLEEGTAGLSSGNHEAGPNGLDIAAAQPTTEPGTPRNVQVPTFTADSDHDGLTDAEEKIFLTDPQKPDTDGDSYNDGLEVNNDYDPAIGESARLATSKNLATYTNTRFGYSVKYPTVWLAKAVDKEESEVRFMGADEEFIEVLVVDNPEHLTAQGWYAKQVPNLDVTEVPTVTVGTNTWAMSLDGLNVYLATDRYLFTLSYNIGTRTEISYYALFRAMLRSFQVTAGNGAVVGGGGNNSNNNTNLNTNNSNNNTNNDLNSNLNTNI